MIVFPTMLSMFIFFASGCPPEDEGGTIPADEPIPATIGEGMTPDQVELADQTPSEPIPSLENYIFPDGRSAAQVLRDAAQARSVGADSYKYIPPSEAIGQDGRRAYLLSAMWNKGFQLADRTQWQFQVEGPDSPEQNGLAYNFGRKQPSVREFPQSCCSQLGKKLHGIDCSGFEVLCAQAADLNLSLMKCGSNCLGDETNWRTILPDGLTMAVVQSESLNVIAGPFEGISNPYQIPDLLFKVATQDIEPGDVLAWPSHGGIVYGDEGTGLLVLQSNGSQGCPPYKAGESLQSECTKNYATVNRGPRTVPISQILRWFPVSNSQTAPLKLQVPKVLRIVPKAHVTLNVENQINNEFILTGSSIDSVESHVSETGSWPPQSVSLVSIDGNYSGSMIGELEQTGTTSTFRASCQLTAPGASSNGSGLGVVTCKLWLNPGDRATVTANGEGFGPDDEFIVIGTNFYGSGGTFEVMHEKFEYQELVMFWSLYCEAGATHAVDCSLRVQITPAP